MPTSKHYSHDGEEIRQLFRTAVDFSVTFIGDERRSAQCRGSGTLVDFGGIRGIVTAAHVIEGLNARAKVRVGNHSRNSKKNHPREIIVRPEDTLQIRAIHWSETGPDIGFVKLNDEESSGLEATASFLNGQKQAKMARDGVARGLTVWHFVVGTIEEMSSVSSSTGDTHTTTLTTVLLDGKVNAYRESEGFDFVNFSPPQSLPSDQPLPNSFGGLSGGGLWSFFLKEQENGMWEFVEKRLSGLAFYESDDPRVITCHGPSSLYERLYSEVSAKWQLNHPRIATK